MKKSKKKVSTVKKATTLADSSDRRADAEKGAALVVALLILLLLMGFAALAISRVTTETIITGNDSSESRAYAAAAGALDIATQEIASELNQSITSPSLDVIKAAAESGVRTSGALPDNYTVATDVSPYGSSCQSLEIDEGPHTGLLALRDGYRLDVTARDTRTEAEVQLMRTFYNDRIPLFQFGQFSEYNLEFMSGPEVYRGGLVHTNQNMFIWGPNSATHGAYFTDTVTVTGEIVNTHNRLGGTIPNRRRDRVYVRKPGVSKSTYFENPKNNSIELKTSQASTECGSRMSPDVFASNSEVTVKCKKRSAWESDTRTSSTGGEGEAKFEGGLNANVPPLQMPLFQLAGQAIEIIKRGKRVGDKANINGSVVDVTQAQQDSNALSVERFANKSGIRISLADSKQRLPGCASSTNGGNDCGVRLDGKLNRSDGTRASVGYEPKPMIGGGSYKTTTLNATRFASPNDYYRPRIPDSEHPGIWIKVEAVSRDGNTRDITEDFLSLGVTEPAPRMLNIMGYDHNITNGTDSRSIIKLQRFTMPGVNIENDRDGGLLTYTGGHNYIKRYEVKSRLPYPNGIGKCDKGLGDDRGGCESGNDNNWNSPSSSRSSEEEDNWHLKLARGLPGSGSRNRIWGYVVPFPIKLFDTRESTGFGIFDKSSLNDRNQILSHYEGGKTLHSSGVMSLVDIDVKNLRRFFNGEFDLEFPNGLNAVDISSDRGWVLYISDRRGDRDFDGNYNEDASLEGPMYPTLGRKNLGEVSRSGAAVSDHQYYRRGVRLINAEQLPGRYNRTTTPCVENANDTQGFTVASENIVYVKGNYNASGALVSTSSVPTRSTKYNPQNSSEHIPAAIAADDVAMLSKAWQDSESFKYPYYLRSNPVNRREVGRVASNTQARFAMISGNQAKRVLENWIGKRQNYSGSLIWIFPSQHGKSSEYPNIRNRLVYDAPKRDFTFEESFRDITRLPPGTPYVSSIGLTGFQRVNE